MLIRTQDKLCLVDTTRMAINVRKYMDYEGTEEKYIIEARTQDGNYSYAINPLGTYYSEEKAIKVLDMIQAAYKDGNGLDYVRNTVFEMPADEEVEV